MSAYSDWLHSAQTEQDWEDYQMDLRWEYKDEL